MPDGGPKPSDDIPAGSWVKFVRELVRKARQTPQHRCPPLLCSRRDELQQQRYLYKGRKIIADRDSQGLFYITKILMERKCNCLSLVSLPVEGEGREGSLSASH